MGLTDDVAAFSAAAPRDSKKNIGSVGAGGCGWLAVRNVHKTSECHAPLFRNFVCWSRTGCADRVVHWLCFVSPPLFFRRTGSYGDGLNSGQYCSPYYHIQINVRSAKSACGGHLPQSTRHNLQLKPGVQSTGRWARTGLGCRQLNHSSRGKSFWKPMSKLSSRIVHFPTQLHMRVISTFALAIGCSNCCNAMTLYDWGSSMHSAWRDQIYFTVPAAV